MSDLAQGTRYKRAFSNSDPILDDSKSLYEDGTTC